MVRWLGREAELDAARVRYRDFNISSVEPSGSIP